MKYNIKFDRKYLDNFHELINEDAIYHKKIKYNEKSKKRILKVYNLICTCVIRIQETLDYLEDFNFRKDNKFKHAFDFYEFINLISIILECENTLFKCFEKNLKDYYKEKKTFIKSNTSKKGDITFFKFIRSATSVHPDNTTNYRNITRTMHEFYPYAMWNIEGAYFNLKKGTAMDFDIALNSWNSNQNCFNKYYTLYIVEFYDFINNLLNCFSYLVEITNNFINKYKNKNKYHRLKSNDKFENNSKYCLYLRDKLRKKSKTNDIEFIDGGLLIASHILSNDILNEDFKNYILNNVIKLSRQMKNDISEITYEYIFSELNMYNLKKRFDYDDFNYVAAKFHDYLEKETRREINNNIFDDYHSSLRYENNNMNYSNREWAVSLLFHLKDFYSEKDLEKAVSFADLYEITLQKIWYYLKEDIKDE